MSQRIQLVGTVPEQLFGKRLDQALAEMFPDYSRSRIKDWILAGCVSDCWMYGWGWYICCPKRSNW